jgi:hypothetical protein
MNMKNDLEETVVAAFMCNQPVILVEGQDDIKFYDNIATLKELSVEVQAIETIDGYSEGCDQVCNAMNNVIPLIEKDNRLKKYVMGIIDRDVRQYLNTVPTNDNLLVLKYYSYETHLITDTTIKSLLEQLTNIPGSLITTDVVDWIKKDFESQTEELFYFSLEALKKRYDNTYQADISYSLNGGAVIGNAKKYRWKLIEQKKDDLDQFAKINSITKNDLKYIAKGKWLLATWCDYLNKKSKTLHSACGKQIPQCSYCRVGQADKCLWKPSSSFQVVEIESLLCSQQFIDLNEVNYIYEYMKENLAC